jgi:hypothetical protein
MPQRGPLAAIKTGHDCRFVIADCRLKNWYCNILRRQSAIGNRKSAIPASLGQHMIAEILRKKRRSLELVL